MVCLSLDGGRGDSEDRALWEPAGSVAVCVGGTLRLIQYVNIIIVLYTTQQWIAVYMHVHETELRKQQKNIVSAFHAAENNLPVLCQDYS